MRFGILIMSQKETGLLIWDVPKEKGGRFIWDRGSCELDTNSKWGHVFFTTKRKMTLSLEVKFSHNYHLSFRVILRHNDMTIAFSFSFVCSNWIHSPFSYWKQRITWSRSYSKRWTRASPKIRDGNGSGWGRVWPNNDPQFWMFNPNLGRVFFPKIQTRPTLISYNPNLPHPEYMRTSLQNQY